MIYLILILTYTVHTATNIEWAIFWGLSHRDSVRKRVEWNSHSHRCAIIIVITLLVYLLLCRLCSYLVVWSDVPDDAFCAHKQCKAALKGLCQPQILLYSGNSDGSGMIAWWYLHFFPLASWQYTFLARNRDEKKNQDE